MFGQSNDEEDPRDIIYIGQTDDFSKRFYNHKRNKEFWDKAVIFTSSNPEGLSRMHTAWLEQALISRGLKFKQAKLDNLNCPKLQNIAEEDEADIQILYNELLDILPLVGIFAFSQGEKISEEKNDVSEVSKKYSNTVLDTIVVPAKEPGFSDVFLNEDCWYAIRISKDKINDIKYIAGYQAQPISAVTHYAKVKNIISYGDTGKYKIEFEKEAVKLENPIVYGNAPSGAMQSTRYTNFEKLTKAQVLLDLFE